MKNVTEQNLEKKLQRSARLFSSSGSRRCLTTPSFTVTSHRMYLLQPFPQPTQHYRLRIKLQYDSKLRHHSAFK